MTIDKTDTSTRSLILEDNIPPPKDRRLGTGIKMPPDLREVMTSMSVGQSFFVESTLDDQKPKIAAIRAAISRYVDRPDCEINENWLFSVRMENEPFRLGVRVWRMEDKED